jgi:hypothetical protein
MAGCCMTAISTCLHPWSAASLDSDSRNIFQESLSTCRITNPQKVIPDGKGMSKPPV